MDSKKIIIAMISIVIIIVILLGTLMFINLKQQTPMLNQNMLNNNVNNSDNKSIQDVTDKSKFYTVTNCVYQYLSEVNKNNSKYFTTDEDEYAKQIEEQHKQTIYDLLSKEYIKNNNVILDNIYNFVDEIDEQVIFTPIQMKVLANTDTEQYVVYGVIQNATNSFIKEIYIGVKLDLNNRAFSIEPIKQGYANINSISIKINNDSIEKNANNGFGFVNVNDEYIAKQYLNAYKRISLAKSEMAYNYLDKEYREARFGNLENYQKYVQTNKIKILQATISKYQVTKNKEYTQYTCITEKGDYYIIRETGLMQYTVILDTYTIELPEYKEKYNKANEQQKTAYCIDRFIQAINDDNYKFAYEVLADGFKNNYFKTQESFEKYAKQYLLGKEKILYKDFKNEGNVYCTYSVILKNNDTNSLQKTFILKLGEGTDFELSFNID